jgi:hypothetical protein
MAVAISVSAHPRQDGGRRADREHAVEQLERLVAAATGEADPGGI